MTLRVCGNKTPSAFAEQSPAHTQAEGDSSQLSSPGEGSRGLLSFPVSVLQPCFTALSASSAPFVPQGLVLLLRAHQEREALRDWPHPCPS